MMKKLAVLIACSVFIQGVLYVAAAASEGDDRAVRYVLEPVAQPDKAGLVQMNFSFVIAEDYCRRCECCDRVDMNVITSGGLEYVGPRIWTAHPDESRTFATTLTVNIPPEDTSSLRIEMMFRGGGGMAAHVYFVSTADSVEFWKGYPQKSFYDRSGWAPDTARYGVRIDLRKKQRRKYIFDCEAEMGMIAPTADSGFYIIRVTRDQVDGLRKEGFDCEYLKEPPPYPLGPPGSKTIWKKDTVNQVRPLKRRRDPQIDGSIWLDYIEGVDASDRIYANQLATFFLGFENNYNDDIQGFSNGFRVHSPDGADWFTTTWDTLGSLAWRDAFDLSFGVYEKSVTGSGADSDDQAYLMAYMFSGGPPPVPCP